MVQAGGGGDYSAAALGAAEVFALPASLPRPVQEEVAWATIGASASPSAQMLHMRSLSLPRTRGRGALPAWRRRLTLLVRPAEPAWQRLAPVGSSAAAACACLRHPLPTNTCAEAALLRPLPAAAQRC